MKILTDLEIRKAITKFELNEQFPKARSIEFDDSQNCFWVDNIGFTSWPLLNPLTDDALCFRLMIKYGIILMTSRKEPKGKVLGYNAWYYELINKVYVEGLNPNKAICLSIIKSKE